MFFVIIFRFFLFSLKLKGKSNKDDVVLPWNSSHTIKYTLGVHTREKGPYVKRTVKNRSSCRVHCLPCPLSSTFTDDFAH